MTDAVITYVNPTDAEWQAEWERTKNSNPAWSTQQMGGSRWRDFGTLPYLIEGILTYMPFVRNIYVVVSSRRQFELCGVSSDKVKMVTHEQIMPKKVLPTFNSTVIELFLYRIPDLAEQFIYFNDDMFPVGPMQEEDFFKNGKPVLAAAVKDKKVYSMYAYHLKNGYNVASRLTGKVTASTIRFGHSASPMLKSSWEKLWKEASADLMGSCTPFRTVRNINQDVVAYYHYLSGQYVPSRRRLCYSTVHKRVETENALHRGFQIVCINDTGIYCDVKDTTKWLHSCFSTVFNKNIGYEGIFEDSNSSSSEEDSR